MTLTEQETYLINCGWKSFTEYQSYVTIVYEKLSGTWNETKNLAVKMCCEMSPSKENVEKIIEKLG